MNMLDNIPAQKKIDPEDMYHKIIHMPDQIREAYKEARVHKPTDFASINRSLITKVVVCGMGGSAISGDIAKAAFGKNLTIEVVKDYEIPCLDDSTLVIALSYSGNTEETLSCLDQAAEVTDFIGVITSGGKAKEIADRKFTWLELPAGFPPRSAIGYLFFSLVKLLEIFQIIEDQSRIVNATIVNLMKKASAICRDTTSDQNFAKKTATDINNKIPVVYSSNPKLSSLAYRWKCQFNENAKYPAFFHSFPEMNHNESEGWESKKSSEIFMPIILNRMQENQKYQKRINAFKKIFSRINVNYLEFFVEGESLIEEIFSLIYLGDMISYYLAILNKVNPTTIDFINFLKKEIS